MAAPSNTAPSWAMEKVAEAVFDAHLEPKDDIMAKKLIIGVAVPGGYINRTHNPHVPLTVEETVKEVLDSYNAGAASWHLHPRDPVTGKFPLSIGLGRRVEVHKEFCDAVFEGAPDIITDVGALYLRRPRVEEGTIVEESNQAEDVMGPLIERLCALGPNNRYVEIGEVLAHTASLGRGTSRLSIHNRAGIASDVEYLQSKGIKPELVPFKHSDISDVKEWLIDTGIARPPVIVSVLYGLHNSPKVANGMDAINLLFTLIRMVPKGVLWTFMVGGRDWLPLTTVAIMLGADMVRVGMEDAVYMYPHRDEYIDSCGRVVEAVAGIARYLGREVATPAEARARLGLPQIPT